MFTNYIVMSSMVLRKFSVVISSVVSLVGLLSVILRVTPIISGDTIAVYSNAQSLVSCFDNSIWMNCPNTNQFGLIQTLPAFFFIKKGVNLDLFLVFASLLNILLLLVLLLVILYLFKNNILVKFLLPVSLFISATVPYAAYTFDQGIQVAIFSFLAISIYRGLRYLGFTSAVLASLTRETSILILMLIFISYYLLFRYDLDSREKIEKYLTLKWTLLGAILGTSLSFLFNIWKFGSPVNTFYADRDLFTLDPIVILSNFLGLFLSPNGGVFLFCFVFMLLIIVLASIFKTFTLGKKLFFLTQISAVIFTAIMLSLWFAPFGWVAWGPRLFLPTYSIVTTSLILIFHNELKHLIKRVSINSISFFSFYLLILMSFFPTLGFILSPPIIDKIFGPTTSCPVPAVIQVDSEYYFNCLLQGTWDLNKNMIKSGFLAIFSIPGITLAVIISANLYLLLTKLIQTAQTKET